MPEPPRTHVSDAGQCWGIYWRRTNEFGHPYLREGGLHREDGPAMVILDLAPGDIGRQRTKPLENRVIWVQHGDILRDTRNLRRR